MARRRSLLAAARASAYNGTDSGAPSPLQALCFALAVGEALGVACAVLAAARLAAALRDVSAPSLLELAALEASSGPAAQQQQQQAPQEQVLQGTSREQQCSSGAAAAVSTSVAAVPAAACEAQHQPVAAAVLLWGWLGVHAGAVSAALLCRGARGLARCACRARSRPACAEPSDWRGAGREAIIM